MVVNRVVGLQIMEGSVLLIFESGKPVELDKGTTKPIAERIRKRPGAWRITQSAECDLLGFSGAIWQYEIDALVQGIVKRV
jgi:hypothetical protein